MSGAKGLWSVSSVNVSNPIRYREKRSHAQTLARHSFSICAYFTSSEVKVREQNATGFS